MRAKSAFGRRSFAFFGILAILCAGIGFGLGSAYMARVHIFNALGAITSIDAQSTGTADLHSCLRAVSADPDTLASTANERHRTLEHIQATVCRDGASTLLNPETAENSPDPSECRHFSKDDMNEHLPHTEALDSPYNRAVFGLDFSGLSPFYFAQKHVGHNPQAILAYVERTSYFPGEMVLLKYAAGLKHKGRHIAEIRIYRADAEKHEKSIAFPPGEYPLSRSECFSFRYRGCDFPTGIEIDTKELEIGPYYAYLIDNLKRSSAPVFFNIRPRNDQLAAYEVLVLLSDTTWHAYNTFAGGGYYGLQRLNDIGEIENFMNTKTQLYSVGLERPLTRMLTFSNHSGPVLPKRDFSTKWCAGFDSLDDAEQAYNRCVYNIHGTPVSEVTAGRYLGNLGVTHAYLGMRDLSAMPIGTLPPSVLLIFIGHNEYFDDRMFTNVEEFIKNGGNVLNVSGNIAWWRVNLDGPTMYRDAASGTRQRGECAELTPTPYLQTGQFRMVADGPETLFGVSYLFGGLSAVDFRNMESKWSALHLTKELVENDKVVKVLEPGHPLFRKLDLADGEFLTGSELLFAHEVDGVPLLDGRVNNRYEADFPEDLTLLASAYSVQQNLLLGKGGTKYMGIVEPAVIVEARPFPEPQSGTVVSFGSIGFSYALFRDDPTAAQIFRNGVEYLKQ